MMVRPKSFGFNPETAMSNSFQNKGDSEDVSVVAQKEFDEMVALFESEKINTKVFEDIEMNLPDSVFPNNWISHIPGQAIVVYPMLTENRKREVRADVIEYLVHLLNESSIIDLRTESDLILEGTGSIIFDHESRTAFACVSPRTDLSLLKLLCDQIDYKTITFESVDLQGKQIYHTNVMLSIADKFAVICLESIPDFIERSMIKKSLESIGKEIVDISYAQMKAFGANALEVLNVEGESYYAMSKTAFKALEKEQIELIEKSSKILPVQIDNIERVGGGSVRCMMAGIFNYPK